MVSGGSASRKDCVSGGHEHRRSHVLESHKHFVKKPNQATLGIKFCIDGANTGQFSDLPVTALKLGLGIHTQEC